MKKIKAILIEDTDSYAKDISLYLKDQVSIKRYLDPDSFAEKCSCPSSLEKISLIVIDFNFGHYDAHAKDLIAYIRIDLNFKGKIIIWSVLDKREIPKDFILRVDKVLPKKLFTLEEVGL